VPRPRVVRERVRALVLRLAVLRGFAAAVERFAVARFAVERVAVERVAVDLLREADVPADLARVVFFAAELERALLERGVLDFARDVVLRLAVERRAVLAAAGSSSAVHLPDITRCAASATASAMSDPSFVALDTMLLAAFDAVSAASSPASRIALRAFGLALIAAAAAASPAASISLLIAALASLSTVLFLVLEVEREDDFEEALLADLAIFLLPPRKRHFSAATVPD
jgi:hypothetical protein